jgi:hypothetical protein
MPSIGRLTTGLALLALVPAVAAAQDRPFTDAWFWGVKGGGMNVETRSSSQFAPTAGLEWLITRTRAGLHLSVEQGFFDDVRSTVADTSSASGQRDVALRNFRRASFALVGFPRPLGTVRPYAGIGMAVNIVQRAVPTGTFASQDAKTEVLQRIEDRRSRTSVLFMGGGQAGLGPVAVFGQATAMPTGGRFLLSGSDTMYLLEAGIRINVGSAIERLDR